MQNFPKFQCKNFSPREGVTDKINNMLNALTDQAPSDSTCIAQVERVDSRFYFEITIFSAVGKFHSQKNYYAHSSIIGSRNWHVLVVEEMCQDLQDSMNDWNTQRVAA